MLHTVQGNPLALPIMQVPRMSVSCAVAARYELVYFSKHMAHTVTVHAASECVATASA